MIQELKDIMRTVPEIEGLVGHEDAGKIMSLKECDGGNKVKCSLQSAFAKLMTASTDMVSEAIAQLIKRFYYNVLGTIGGHVEQLVFGVCIRFIVLCHSM